MRKPDRYYLKTSVVTLISGIALVAVERGFDWPSESHVYVWITYVCALAVVNFLARNFWSSW